jgi:hypothetical protein
MPKTKETHKLIDKVEIDEETGVVYTDNPEIGELEIIENFLPPEEFVLRQDNIEVTLNFSISTIGYFKLKAAQLNVPYELLIRNLVDEHARQRIQEETKQS